MNVVQKPVESSLVGLGGDDIEGMVLGNEWVECDVFCFNSTNNYITQKQLNTTTVFVAADILCIDCDCQNVKFTQIEHLDTSGLLGPIS